LTGGFAGAVGLPLGFAAVLVEAVTVFADVLLIFLYM